MWKFLFSLIIVLISNNIYAQFDNQTWVNSQVLNSKLKFELDRNIALDSNADAFQQGLFFVYLKMDGKKIAEINLDSAGRLTSFGPIFQSTLSQLFKDNSLIIPRKTKNDFILPVIYSYRNKSKRSSSAKEILDKLPTVNLDSLISNTRDIPFQLKEKQIFYILKFKQLVNSPVNILPVYYYSNVNSKVI